MYLDHGTRHAGVVLSGIGGWEEGLARAGWQIIFSAERDEQKRAHLAARRSGVVCYDSVASVSTSLRHGLYVMGGLPEHSCQGGVWQNCMDVLDRVDPRWVVIETVHTVFAEAWPGAWGRLQRDLADRSYSTMWVGTLFASADPPVRWARVIVIGWPLGCGIPDSLSMMHGRVMIVGNVDVALSSRLGQVYARQDTLAWQQAVGFDTSQAFTYEQLEASSVPAVTYHIGKALFSADEHLSLMVGTVDDTVRHALP